MTLKQENAILKVTLKLAKKKIEAYVDHFGGEYPGGVPLSSLLREIDRCLRKD